MVNRIICWRHQICDFHSVRSVFFFTLDRKSLCILISPSVTPIDFVQFCLSFHFSTPNLRHDDEYILIYDVDRGATAKGSLFNPFSFVKIPYWPGHKREPEYLNDLDLAVMLKRCEMFSVDGKCTWTKWWSFSPDCFVWFQISISIPISMYIFPLRLSYFNATVFVMRHAQTHKFSKCYKQICNRALRWLEITRLRSDKNGNDDDDITENGFYRIKLYNAMQTRINAFVSVQLPILSRGSCHCRNVSERNRDGKK